MSNGTPQAQAASTLVSLRTRSSNRQRKDVVLSSSVQLCPAAASVSESIAVIDRVRIERTLSGT